MIALLLIGWCVFSGLFGFALCGIFYTGARNERELWNKEETEVDGALRLMIPDHERSA